MKFKLFPNWPLKVLHRTLENPHTFNAVIKIFGIGGRGRALHEFIHKTVVEEANQAVLEIGSGTGQFQEHFVAHADSYIAIDVNIDYLFHSRKENGRPHFVCCSSISLPFRSKSFDRVFALFMFHHLSDQEALGTLGEIKRCLKASGKLIIVDPFRDQRPWDVLGKVLVRVDRGRWIRHRRELENLLQRTTFSNFSEDKLPRSWPYDMSIYKVG